MIVDSGILLFAMNAETQSTRHRQLSTDADNWQLSVEQLTNAAKRTIVKQQKSQTLDF